MEALIDGLYRCDANGQFCYWFTGELPVSTDRVYRAVIDRGDNTVYVMDSGQAVLYKCDAAGRLLASQDKEFKYPYQIALHNNRLFVANTNHHEISIEQTDTSNFCEKID